jgi:hypothetical protein
MKFIFSLLVPVFLSHSSFGQISVTIITPENNLVDTSTVVVRARVTPGEYEITSVIATIENRQVSLINIGPYFQGTLSTSGLTIDSTYVLTITATDFIGNQGTVTKNVIVDPPPKIDIQLPVNYEVATPQLQIKAAANDNSDCRLVVVIDFGYPTYQVAFRDTFMNSVDTTISLSDSGYQGLSPSVNFRAIDSRGQVQDSYRKIYVESSPYLERVFSTEGIINDMNYGKVLSYFNDYSPDNNRNSIIANISTGQSSEIPNNVGVYSYLTPTGAVFVTGSVSEWNNGLLYALDPGPASTSGFDAAGNYAIWSSGFGGSNLYVRNMATHTTTLISAAAGNSENSVAANGTVAYWGNDYNIRKYANGISTIIAPGVYPMTDGKLVVWQGNLYDGATTTQLGATSTNHDYAYRVTNGFVAYTKTGASGQNQIWLRDTTGLSRQITFYSISSQLDVLAPNGSFSFTRQESNSWRYLYDISTNKFKALAFCPYGKMFNRDSTWYVSLGRVLFKVKPNFSNTYYTVKNGNWSNPATWFGKAVPPTGADVTVTHNIVVDVDATCNTVAVKSSAAVTVNTGINFVVLH